MHETLIALLPLLAGYWFTQSFALTRILSQRYDGYHRLWFTAAFAVPFVCCGRLVTAALHLMPAGRRLEKVWFVVFPPADFPYAGTAVAAAVAGGAASCVLLAWRLSGRNRSRSKSYRLPFRIKAVLADPFEGYAWAARILEDHLVDLLIETTRRKGFVMVTLDSRKVYLGAVIRYPALYPERAYLGLLPAYSGYRGERDFRVRWTVDYTPVWAGRTGHSRLAELLVIIPVSRIQTAQSYEPAPAMRDQTE